MKKLDNNIPRDCFKSAEYDINHRFCREVCMYSDRCKRRQDKRRLDGKSGRR